MTLKIMPYEEWGRLQDELGRLRQADARADEVRRLVQATFKEIGIGAGDFLLSTNLQVLKRVKEAVNG